MLICSKPKSEYVFPIITMQSLSGRGEGLVNLLYSHIGDHATHKWQSAKKRGQRENIWITANPTVIEALTTFASFVLDANIYMLVFLILSMCLKPCGFHCGFIHGLCKIINISLLGASIHACKCNGRHLVAYKEESSLFNAILSWLRDTIPTPSSGRTMV